jgi:7-cyano-7-deazaguanine synthase
LKKAVVLCSGGMDSVTALGLTKKQGFDCYVLFVDYGQKTAVKEKQASIIASERFGANFKDIILPSLSELTNTLLIHESGNTEVQGRNAVLISLAVSYAQTINAIKVVIGLQEQDVPYKDAHGEFLDHINRAMQFAYNVEISAPLLDKSKIDIIRIAQQLNIDLDLTYSCYFKTDQPCGECPSCLVRSSAEKEINFEQ